MSWGSGSRKMILSGELATEYIHTNYYHNYCKYYAGYLVLMEYCSHVEWDPYAN